MRVLEAVKRVRDGTLALPELWSIATRPERVTVALILGLPAELPKQAATPAAAWNAINRRQQMMVLNYAPDRIKARLPTALRPPLRLIPAEAAPSRRQAGLTG